MKYSPNTALTVSGIVSSLRDFLSKSSDLTMSSDMDTIIFSPTLVSLPLATIRNPNIAYGVYRMVAKATWQQFKKWRLAK